MEKASLHMQMVIVMMVFTEIGGIDMNIMIRRMER